MKKTIHTHCKNHKCGKKLPLPSSKFHYCRNNNKCKNEHHNSIRKAKTELAESIIQSTVEYYNLEYRLNMVLKNRRIRTVSIDDLYLMGIDLTSPLISLESNYSNDLTFIEFAFANFQLYYFVLKNEVSICKGFV